MRRAFTGALALSLLGVFNACSSAKPHTGDSAASAGAGSSDLPPANAGGTTSPSSAGASSSSRAGSSNAEAMGGSTASGGARADLGQFPYASSTLTRGGTMTFSNIGAPGSWPRRLDRPAGDPACNYKDGTDTWGGHCCQENYETTSDQLAPFDEEMTLIFKAIDIKQLAVYQPSAATGSSWARVTAWDQRGHSDNLWFTQNADGSAQFPGDLTKNDCVGYVSQAPLQTSDGLGYWCPDDPGVLHRGFSGSKLVVFLGSLDVDDAQVKACSGTGAGAPGPWVAFVASELIRDGGRKWNGLCNCYSKTGTVGDGCGEINVFEVVLDNNDYSNREFASTGVRSYQAGALGSAVCKSDCKRDAILPTDVEVVDACAKTAYAKGPSIVAGGATDGCPVWRRPQGDRYFFILLDEQTRQIQVGIVHPDQVPAKAAGVLPKFPGTLARTDIDSLLELRLPE